VFECSTVYVVVVVVYNSLWLWEFVDDFYLLVDCCESIDVVDV